MLVARLGEIAQLSLFLSMLSIAILALTKRKTIYIPAGVICCVEIKCKNVAG